MGLSEVFCTLAVTVSPPGTATELHKESATGKRCGLAHAQSNSDAASAACALLTGSRPVTARPE
jgi:hypothetical protein